ncbi:hypothetical protein CK203_061826 [Vitis vinifera]|uniref:Uncharacterized protein n=1 Tax=Vitis vinifera TaxID=29760 RepID=A0A438GIY8_VITVI|nr:hypothetical protein CK203_061826 [Vitis vinifera]
MAALSLTSSAQSKFLPIRACIILFRCLSPDSHRTPGNSSTHFPLACSSLFFKAVINFRTEISECNAIKLWTIVGYNGVWNSKMADDVFPYELSDILSLMLAYASDSTFEVICGDEQKFLLLRRTGPLIDLGTEGRVCEGSLVQVPHIMVKRAACIWTLCASWDLQAKCMSGGNPSRMACSRCSPVEDVAGARLRTLMIPIAAFFWLSLACAKYFEGVDRSARPPGGLGNRGGAFGQRYEGLRLSAPFLNTWFLHLPMLC